MAKKATGQYRLRIQILPRALAAAGANNEKTPSWAENGPSYFAGRDALNAGEVLQQGIANTTGFMKIRIKGRAIPVNAVDRVKNVATGELFNITGIAREFAETVLTLDRVTQQTTPQ